MLEHMGDLLTYGGLFIFVFGMAWNDGVDRAANYIVTNTNWNDLIGAAGSLMQLKSHAHGGTTGEGSQSLGPLVKATFTDAAAPAAPAAGQTSIYTVSAKPRYRANGGADRAIITDETAAAGDLAGTYPSPTVAKITLGSDADGDLYYRSGGVLVRRGIGSTGQLLTVSGGVPTWATGGNVTVLDKVVSTTTVVSSVTETTIYTKTISANSLGATGGLRLQVWMDWLNSFGGNTSHRLKVKFGATTIFDTGVSGLVSSNASRGDSALTVGLLQSATNAQRWGAILTHRHNSDAPIGVINSSGSSVGPQVVTWPPATSSEDTTANKDLVVTIQLGDNSANVDWRTLLALLEQIA